MEVNIHDLVQIVIFLGSFIAGIWKFSSVLNDLKTELKLIGQKMETFMSEKNDHEGRIRKLEAIAHIDK